MTEINTFIDELIVKFKDFKYMLYILYNGEFSTFNSDKYKGIQVFISPNISEDNNIYCSCDGPTKENWTGGKKFYVCTICKKEKLVKTLDVENEEKFINEWKHALSKCN